MKEIKTDLFPKNLYEAKNTVKPERGDDETVPPRPTEPLPESKRQRKDGPGGE